MLSPKASAVSILWAVVLYFGFCLFMLSFSLPAVGTFTGMQCAGYAIHYWGHDDKISSLALFGGWLNPQVLLLFLLSVFRVAPRLRAVLVVTILFSIPMTWIAIHRMDAAGMFMELKAGHFLWVAGILLIVLPSVPLVFAFLFARWLAAAGAAVIAFLTLPLLIAFTMHPASEKDDFLYVVAWTLKEPTLCGKIDPHAIGRPDQRDSTDFTYMQSDCYRNVNAMIHEPQLCDNVKSAGVDRLVGSFVAKFRCRKQKYTWGSAMPGSGPNFIRAMKSFGVTDEYLTKIHYERRQDTYLLPILNELQADLIFLSRLQASPSYAELPAPGHQRDAHPLEFLDQVVAVQWDIPDLCQKISPNARAYPSSAYALSLQATCFANIAFNRRDDSLCRKLPRAKNSQETNQGTFLEGCMKNVAILRGPNSHSGRSGPGVVPTWPQFQEAIQELGYPPTTSWLHLPRPTPEEYGNYLWELTGPERDDFVRRILAVR